jgi:hypothetical protein
MDVNLKERLILLDEITNLLTRLRLRQGVNLDEIDVRANSLVELAALRRILHELLYNPPPRADR